MNRKVFLIGAPLSYESPEFVTGVNTDIENYYNFFKSPTGGGFNEDEIICLENPSFSMIRGVLALNRCSFATLVFSGHGGIGINSQNTFLSINSYETVALIDIIKLIRSERKFIITDTCRNYIKEKEHFGFGGPEAKIMDFPSNLSIERARRLFDIALENTEPGVQILYSCSDRESSHLTPDGSYFTNAMLSAIREWSLKIEDKSILLGVGAHNFSKSNIKHFPKKQTPTTYKTSVKSNFPFAIRRGSELQESRKLNNSFDFFNKML